MEREQPFASAHDPEVLYTKSKKELFRDVIEAEHNGIQHNMVDYLSAFLKSGGYELKIENGEKPDPDRQLILALNHHSRQLFFTTEESLRAVAIASVSVRESGLSAKHIAWMIRKLDIPAFGIGRMARQVQNATSTVFGSIPAKTTSELKWKGFMPHLREGMTEEDLRFLNTRVAQNVQAQNILGVFPEQVPTWKIKPHHRNFPRVLSGVRLLAGEVQIPTLSIFYEGKVARANFGPVIQVSRDADVQKAAIEVMHGIAQGLPRHLKGDYSKAA